MSFLLVIACVGTASIRAETQERGTESLRAELRRVGEISISRDRAPENLRKTFPNTHALCNQLLKSSSSSSLAEAIDQALRSGGVEEKTGALEMYWYATGWPGAKLEPRPDYRTLLIDLLRADDQSNLTYSGTLVSVLCTFPSRETVLALLDTSHRTKDPKLRETLLEYSASLLGMRTPIHNQMTALEKERTLNDLEAWLEQNRDRIRFKKGGRPYLAGGESGEKPVELAAEDRARIRKDPACVLKLLNAMMGGDSAGADLAGRCGAALLGTEGAQALQEALQKGAEEGPPSFDRQMAIASARGNYPTMDAVQLAVAYVAAYETDSGVRKLAMEVYDELGTSDIERVLKGESREVRKKARELVDQVTGED